MGRRQRERIADRRPRRPQGSLRHHGETALIALDTNILVYAHRQEFSHHVAALSALRDLAEGEAQWAIPVFVLAEFVRIVTHPSVLRPPSTPGLAIAALDALVMHPGAVVLNPGDRFWEFFREAVIEERATGNLTFDAQIVAVCREQGVDEILTEDRDFARFSGFNVRRLR
ncbi:MAG: TA system VapC family ribonuclease toxin [Actinomycetota bacterium]|nr:PIN domain-containing protein [Actinomycetota bacterium]